MSHVLHSFHHLYLLFTSLIILINLTLFLHWYASIPSQFLTRLNNSLVSYFRSAVLLSYKKRLSWGREIRMELNTSNNISP